MDKNQFKFMKKKKNIFVLLLFTIGICVSLSSCEEHFHTEEPVVARVVDVSYVPAHNEYKYGYGYSPIRGKFCWHYGYFYEGAQYITHLEYDNIVYAFNSKELYEKVDSATNKVGVTLIKVYKIVEKDTIFVEERIHL